MSSQFRRSNGRFAKKKVVAKEIKCVAAMSKAKKKCIKDVVEENIICTGQRIVNLSELGKNQKCCKCKKVLNLENTVAEKLLGLHSVLTICKQCNVRSAVHTGKKQKSNGQSYAESNLTVVLGSIHSDMSSTGLKKLLYKRYEQVVGSFVEEAAKDSCKRGAEEERRLMLENIEKICQQLPSDVVEDIFPHLNRLRSCPNPDPTHSQHMYENSPNPTFDAALENLLTSLYPMIWVGANAVTGKAMNGYTTIIGFLSKKILDFTTRNRKCCKCDAGHSKE